VKAKAVVRIALGLRFAHGVGLLHGAAKASNILVDADRRIQIAGFSPLGLEAGAVEPFSVEGLECYRPGRWNGRSTNSGIFSQSTERIIRKDHGIFENAFLIDVYFDLKYTEGPKTLSHDYTAPKMKRGHMVHNL
jgi:serine/threonine protein kinase